MTPFIAVLSILAVGHLLALIQLRRAWTLHEHSRPGEGSFVWFIHRRRVPAEEFVGTGYVRWRSARWISLASIVAAGAVLVLLST